MVRFSVTACVIAVSISGTCLRASDKLDVSIEVSRTEYLLGEPVPLNLVVRNLSREDLTIQRVPYDCDEQGRDIEIYISHAGGDFERFALNQGTCGQGPMIVLKEGGSLSHPERILYGRSGQGLAFPLSGEYRIKTIYPVPLPGSLDEKLESNTVRIRVHRPTGEDALAWSRLASQDVFDFLQFGAFNDSPSPGRAIAKLISALKAHPKSRYRSIYVDDLRKFAEHNGERFLSEVERIDFREIIGIP